MKLTDALLHAWRDTLRRARNASAIFNADGKVLRTFGEIEECACEFEDDFEMFPPGRVIAIQIGNHEDWPSLLIACLRRQLVVLPLEESISAQQRDAALRLCNATAVVSAVPSGSEHDLAGSRRNALRTMHTTAIFDSIAVSRWSADSLGPDFADWFLVCEISGLPIWGFVRRVVSSDVNRAFRANGFWVP